MMKDKIIGIIAGFIGICWLIGGTIGSIDSIIIGYQLGDIVYFLGTICGATIVLVLGFFITRYGYKKIRTKTNNKLV